MNIHILKAALIVVFAAVSSSAQSLVAQDPEPLAATVSATPQEIQAAAASAHGPSLVAYCSLCAGLVSSTGNLYYTNFGINEFGPNSASFYRTGKYSTPGTEGLLYNELRSTYFNFGSVVWALVNGTYYGYFVANYEESGVRFSEIKRVPLAGGAAVVLYESLSYIGVGDLVTDGTALFFNDEGGIRRLPLNNGAVSTLVAAASISHITLDPNYIFYSQGNEIFRVSKTGGSPAPLYVAPAVITALYVWSGSSSYSVVFWGEHGGAVRSVNSFGGSPFTWQNAIAGRDVTSVGYTGARALWIDCTEPGNSVCTGRVQSGGVTPATFSAGVGAGHLQWDSTSMYWIGVPGIQRYVY